MAIATAEWRMYFAIGIRTSAALARASALEGLSRQGVSERASRPRENVRHSHCLPTPTTSRSNATSIERLGNGAQRARPGLLHLSDDRQHVCGVAISIGLDRLHGLLARLGELRASQLHPTSLGAP